MTKLQMPLFCPAARLLCSQVRPLGHPNSLSIFTYLHMAVRLPELSLGSKSHLI